MPEILYTVEDAIATVTLNRPEKRNAFTLSMVDEWAAAYRRAAADDAVRVVILTGAGPGFCSGLDMDDSEDISRAPMARKRMLTERVHPVARACEDLDKPLIAAVNGVAVGAGLDMALMCDMRFAAQSARMGETYIRHGVVAGDGGCWYLPRIVGTAKALELLLSGQLVDADEALRISLVNRVYPDDDLMAETREFARRLAGFSPHAIALTKRSVYQAERMDLRTALDLASSHLGVLYAPDDEPQP